MAGKGAASHLWYGDNLVVLREHVADASVDLVYLDPPFNSNATYNVLFKAPGGEASRAQIEAFDDTWHWNETAERAFDEVMGSGHSDAAEMLRAMRSFLGENDMMAYLAMMAVRLIELHRVLKPTGSLYLHCDPTASHYLKILLDAIFLKENFRNEIIWRRTGSHNSTRRYGPIHDTIFFYTKSKKYTWHGIKRPYMAGHVRSAFIFEDGVYRTNYSGNILTGSGTRKGLSGKAWRGFDPTKKGRHWALPSALVEGYEEEVEGLNQHEKMDFLYEKGLITINPTDEWPRYNRIITTNDGQRVSDIWAYQPYTNGTVFGTDLGIDDDVRWMGSKDSDRLHYPTQKPISLLERVITASSNEGDVVLDPFCGCGTTVHAAEKLKRRWIGIDVTHLAVGLIKRRLVDAFPMASFDVLGVPKDVEAARELAATDKHQFQLWALSTIEAQPYKGGKKGADGGVDGYIWFKPDGKKTERAIVSVKGGGNVGVVMIRDLIATIEREKARIGIFLTLEPPTGPMKIEAASAGFYESPLHGKFPRIQILTVEEMFKGHGPQIPWVDPSSFKKAKRETTSVQRELDL